MKAILRVACGLLCLCLAAATAMAQEEKQKSEKFGALAHLKKDKKGKEKGEGVLIYAAKVKVLDGNRLDIEHYAIEPIRLMAVRKL
jgi:hypothetical protein